MASESQSIREILNLLESARTPEPVVVNEGWAERLGNFWNRRLGDKEREQLAGRVSKEWSRWLGQSDRQGSLEDMVAFMRSKVGFTTDDIEAVFARHKKQHPDEWDGGEEDESAEEPAKSIKRGGGQNAEEEPKEPRNSEGGRSMPSDLDTKLSDYDEVGQKASVESAVDDYRRYMTKGKPDQQKIINKLRTMEPGQKLQLDWPAGTKTYSLGRADESVIMESGQPLSRASVKSIMNVMAAYLNDTYIHNGVRNSEIERRDAKMAMAMKGGAKGIQAALDMEDGDAGPREPRERGQGPSQGSGRYNSQEMSYQLQQVSYPKDRMNSLARKVVHSKSISEMSDQDIQELALIGFSFLKARS